MNPLTYSVAVDAPIKTALTYLGPEDDSPLQRGESVVVPLGKRKAHGLVLGPCAVDADTKGKLKPILSRDLERPPIPKAYVKWSEWLSQYYIYPVGQILDSIFPPLGRSTKRKSRKAPVVNDQLESRTPPALTSEQQRVIQGIQNVSGFGVHLLHGVTGSGKTEVYLQLLQEVLAKGLQGLVLVPEISLTPQLIERFSRRFPNEVAVLHSHLTEREKTNQWWSMVNKERHILIGARSALFCPLETLGLIVIDEEHEPSYKQDEKLKYHARDAAIVLARELNIPVVLGSATPSLESWANASNKKFHLHQMFERVNARPLPEISVVDLREQNEKRKSEPSELPFWLSESLAQELRYTFQKNEQAALFLNRRGIAQTAHCKACGFSVECPNCSVTLTVHGQSHLVCHFCDYTERISEKCPNCQDGLLEPLGLGTERIESDMRALFPEIRIARADRDEVQSREQLENLIQDVESHRVDLLIGTQMIAKGLDFPKLNLVGLVLADVGFHWPDFRAGERSFQLLTQVSGRSGRQNPGKVVIQTYDPSHLSVRHTVDHDYLSFATAELQERADMLYPPAWRMAMLRIQGASLEAVKATAQQAVQRGRALQQQNKKYADQLVILGPAPAPMLKLRGNFRYQILIKCNASSKLNSFCRQILANDQWVRTGTKVQVDIDPFQML